MDLLKKELAPITPEAWQEIEDTARGVLTTNLGGRKLVDFDGPHGWTFAAINLGSVDLLDDEPVEGVHVGQRQVQRLVEVRVPFTLDLMVLDTIARGARAADLAPVEEAAERIARFENRAIFSGVESLDVTGIIGASAHDPVAWPSDPSESLQAILEAGELLGDAGVGGPYGLALGPTAWRDLARATEEGYPLRRRVDEVLEGPMVWVPELEGAVLLSQRGGDFELTVGQDLSVGYAAHDRDAVELYLTETFSFRVLDPAAAVPLSG